ncbi:CRISPR-associated protein Cas5 [Ruminiclostridium josui]|uniref:CRISPR-associated protein Cas5 n=1 Tax=Ruminiclostridium josui TaxID=1499 RepID=UPI0004632653|nr:CRISPR-associated protein Cas5 [Ruminiclostridium josui]
MKVLSFELNGKMAHFRKYYSNSTALSYMLPPVATIKGILAGLLGYERDTYYNLFTNDLCKVAICVNSPIKKITQRMNLLKVERISQLNGSAANRTQNDTEFIIPKDIRTGYVSYKIIFWHSETSVIDELSKLLCKDTGYYSSKGICMALGSAQCIGWIQNAKVTDAEKHQSTEEMLELYGAINLEYLKSIEISEAFELSMIKEESITDFDENRFITEDSKKKLLVNLLGTPVSAVLHNGTDYISIENKNYLFVK